MGPQGGAWAYMWKPEGSPEAARGFATAPKYQPGLLVLSGLLANDRFGLVVGLIGMGWERDGWQVEPTWGLHGYTWTQMGPTSNQMEPRWKQNGAKWAQH
jgi:hypothetical protein